MASSPSAPPRFTATAVSSHERNGETYFRGATANSTISEADAKRLAHQLAHARAVEAATGRIDTRDGAYPYPERVLVEPILDRLAADGTEIARVTRNRYDASVLNSYGVMFVDVDTTDDMSNAHDEKVVAQETALAALISLCDRDRDLNFRVYLTRAGLRYLCTSRVFDPVSAESQEILRFLHADPRYATLCRVQKCYRARLTPKPWRCEVKQETSSEKKGFFARIFADHPRVVRMPQNFATCRFLETVGSGVSIAEAERIVAFHDAAVEAKSDKPLA